MYAKPKNYLALAIALSLLSACGGGSGDSSTPTPTPTPAPTPTPTPAPTPDPVTDHSGLEPISSDQPDTGEYLAGGDATLFVSGSDAFSLRPEPIAQDFQLDGNFTSGDHIFRTPHSGMGPLLNTSNCQGCHIKDGRGFLPEDADEPFTAALVKLGDGDGAPDPMYGDQIQTFAVQSFDTSDFESGWPVYGGSLNGDVLVGEAYPYIEWEMVNGNYADGTAYELRRPIYKFKDMSFGDFVDDIRFSPRVAPHVFGSGLLETIPQENLLALADPDDSDGDGISGRASMVMDVSRGEMRIGRFAYKAQTPSVLQQTAGAYRGDVGITSSIFIEENCTSGQVACQAIADTEDKTGNQPDITDRELALVEFYNRVLGVPARRGYDRDNDVWDSDIVAGRELFFTANCAGCHTPRHLTGEAEGSLLGEITLISLEPDPEPIAMLSNQTIYPFTDLLLHDMGGSCQVSQELSDGAPCESGASCYYVQRCEGLADGLSQGDASGSEWKTPALWGLGLVTTVNPKASFLHDGRARTIEEAILWHGGEAQASRDAFVNFSAAERQQLLDFLQSL